MTSQSAKPPLLLLDANIIIEAHAVGVWQLIVDSFEVTIPSIVARQEAKYFTSGDQQKPINLSVLVSQGKIKEMAADAQELSELMTHFNPVFRESIHIGEQEALALLLANRCPDHLFCSGDARPLQALAMLSMSDRSISLEEILKKAGRNTRLDEQYTKAFRERQVAEGQRRRIQCDGLSPTSRFTKF